MNLFLRRGFEAVTLCNTYFALIYEWSRRGGKLDIEGAIAQTLDIVLNGLSDRKIRRAPA